MRKVRLLAAATTFLFMASCGDNDAKTLANASATMKDTTNFTSVRWLDSLIDIGSVKHGTKPEVKFKFENSGTKPLYIISAKPSCGCTVADYPKEAIAPGKRGAITAIFNAKYPAGEEFHKSITVETNTTGRTITNLYFAGKIAADSTSQRDSAQAIKH